MFITNLEFFSLLKEIKPRSSNLKSGAVWYYIWKLGYSSYQRIKPIISTQNNKEVQLEKA